MPHIIIECTENIFPEKPDNVLLKAADALAKKGAFEPLAIKSRLHPVKYSTLGVSAEDHAFVAAEIVLLEPKTSEEIDGISQTIQNVLLAYFKDISVKTSVTTRVVTFKQEAYKKSNNF